MDNFCIQIMEVVWVKNMLLEKSGLGLAEYEALRYLYKADLEGNVIRCLVQMDSIAKKFTNTLSLLLL